MKSIKCWFGFHDWEFNKEEMSNSLFNCYNTAMYRKYMSIAQKGTGFMTVFAMKCARCGELRPETNREQLEALKWNALKLLAEGEILHWEWSGMNFRSERFHITKFSKVEDEQLLNALKPYIEQVQVTTLDSKWRAKKSLITMLAEPS